MEITNHTKYYSLLIAFLIFLLGSSTLQAQKREMQKAIEHYQFQEYTRAIPWFKKAIEKNKGLYTAEKLLAASYRKTRQFEMAELHYLLVVNSDSVEAEDHLYFGQVLKANGKLAAAKEQFSKFSALAKNSFLGNIMIQSIDEIKSWEQLPKEFDTEEGGSLNSSESEFSFLIWRDKIYLASDRGESYYSTQKSSWTGGAFLSIYETDTAFLNDPEEYKFRVAKGLINSQYHDGPLSISPTEDRVMISRIGNDMRGNDFVNQMKLYEGKLENGKWKEFEPFPYNSDDYSVGHAVYADSGNTLYFASNMPGGFGEMDLYFSKREGSSWSKPKNLGPAINTPQNEVFPYVKDSVLYYSSNGFVGYGGLDIFSAKKQGNGWQAPENLKRPINSNRDDFSIYFVTDTIGYYASNRDGGKGKDDLYSFVKTAPQIAVEIDAILELAGLPVDGAKVRLVNDQDSTVQLAYTDKEGKVSFKNLPYQNDYLIIIDAEDDEELASARLFQLDEEGNKLRLLAEQDQGVYPFRALPLDEIRLAMEDEVDPGTLTEFVFLGQVFEELPGDLKQQMKVYLLNEAGEIVDSIMTDENGKFQFEQLNSEENYLVRLAESDPSLEIAFVNKAGKIYNLGRRDRLGLYQIEQQIDASEDPVYAKNQGYTTLLARLEHNGAPLTFTKVRIYDAQNRLVATVISNEAGEFQYNTLQFDAVYYIELVGVDDQIKLESRAVVIDKKGNELYLIDQLKSGKFKFNSLPFDEYDDVQNLTESQVPNIVRIIGQIYDKLPGDINEATMIYIKNEAGDIIDSVLTDSRGRFVFEKLESDEQYAFSLASSDSVNLAFLDEDNIIIDKAIFNEDGDFTYEKLTYQIAQFENIDAEEVALIDEYDQIIQGQVYQKLPGDFGDSLVVYVYDDEGNLLGTTFTDLDGKFKFEDLKADENYFFKIGSEADNYQLLTFDEEAAIINKMIKNKKGEFTYAKLNLQDDQILLADAKDQQLVFYDDDRIDLTEYTVNYRFDKSSLEKSEREKLHNLIKKLKEKTVKIEVISHTDIRGSKDYNKRLSAERTNAVIEFLKENGLTETSFVANYYGELRPIIDCEKYACDNDDHRLNRRTEFKFLDPELDPEK